MLQLDSRLKDELKQFFVIAIPLSAAYLAEFAMFITTKMVVGKLGYHSLAAVGIAGDLTFEILIVLMALLSIIGVLAAQAHGAGKKMNSGMRSSRELLSPPLWVSRQCFLSGISIWHWLQPIRIRR